MSSAWIDPGAILKRQRADSDCPYQVSTDSLGDGNIDPPEPLFVISAFPAGIIHTLWEISPYSRRSCCTGVLPSDLRIHFPFEENRKARNPKQQFVSSGLATMENGPARPAPRPSPSRRSPNDWLLLARQGGFDSGPTNQNHFACARAQRP